jgi:hypothetical protein
MVYDSQHFPADLKAAMYAWIKTNLQSEREEGQTEEQFIYKARKKALGQFKKEIMGMPQATREAIAGELEQKFEFLFKQLNAVNNKELVVGYVPMKRVIVRKRDAEGEQYVHSGEGAD